MGSRKIVIIMEYSISQIMDIYKLKIFKANLEKFKKSGNDLKIVFYGDYTDEELAVNMAYFNRLVNSKICDYAISFKTKEIIIEAGINNRSIAKEKVEVTEKNIKEQVSKLYKDKDIEIMVKSNKHWEDVLLDLIKK